MAEAEVPTSGMTGAALEGPAFTFCVAFDVLAGFFDFLLLVIAGRTTAVVYKLLFHYLNTSEANLSSGAFLRL